MSKLLYLLATVVSFVTFMLGYVDLLTNGFSTNNVLLITITPILSFLLTFKWIKNQNDDTFLSPEEVRESLKNMRKDL